MSGLLGSLAAAARALEAQRFGLDTVGHNIANVNTPGFTRREVVFGAVAPPDQWSAGGGVEVVALRAARDQLIERRLFFEQPAEQREAAVADALGVVEAAIGEPGTSLDARLSAFFDAWGVLATDPTSGSARQEVILQGQSLATSFRTIAGRLSDAQRDADTQIRSLVERINDLAGRIASLNGAIGGEAQAGALLHFQDQQTELVQELSGLIDIQTLRRADGGLDISFGNGRALVIGAQTYAVGINSTAPSGYAALTSGGVDVTAEVTSGKVGGLLRVRDVLVPDYKNRLDTLAYEVVSRVNTTHQAGFDLNGTAGGVFFTAIGAVAGAAALVAVDATLAANPSKVAAAGSTSAGDNQAARNMVALRDTKFLNGGLSTFSDAWGELAYRVGRDAQAARQERQTRGDVLRQVLSMRDMVSGVSLDEEAMSMMKFQRAYEANARFFQLIDETLDTLLRMVR
ncbi:MAG: flagellar hook-associated protein FlgK [Acidobacteria bacterium]|nr:flagellar hook-associated protein FlgK [Acidobacteriota bacterium]